MSSDNPFTPPPPASAVATPSIPGHELLRRFAKGSYGELWLARNELGALRAVKIVRRSTFTNAKPYDREFAGIQRYEPISREHEGLVDVLQVGQDEAAGFFYYVMELADDAAAPDTGCSILDTRLARSSAIEHQVSSIQHPDRYIPLTLSHLIHQRGRLPANEVIEIGIKLARALEFLHSRKLIHRDVKPSNIIFVGGQPKLADVGLVADLGNPQSLVGTEGYIPPEGPGTAQADIYSLGKVLYEAATGKDRQEFPDLPTRLGDEQDDNAIAELNEVLLKACEGQARLRYHTAGEMADDLEQLRGGQSLRLRAKRQRRLRSVVMATAVLAAMAVSMIGVVRLIQHERYKPRLVFRDDFNQVELDTNQWTWSHTGSGTGSRRHHIEISGGELVLQTSTEHGDGDSTTEIVWCDLKSDIRSLGACVIEAELSGETSGGVFAVGFTDGQAPENDSAFALNEALTCNGMVQRARGETNRCSARLRIQIIPRREAALVYKAADRADEFDVLVLRTLPKWHLRFACASTTSRGYRSGAADIRIKRVSIIRQPDEGMIVGRITEDISDWPVRDAVIVDATGKTLGKTPESGAFFLRGTPSSSLMIKKADYEGSLIPPDRLQSGQLLELRLRKLRFAKGDVVGVIPYGKLDIKAIGFRQGELLAFTFDPTTMNRFIRVDTVTMKPDETKRGTPVWTQLVSFAECKGQFLGLDMWCSSNHNGVLFDLSTNPPRGILELTTALLVVGRAGALLMVNCSGSSNMTPLTNAMGYVLSISPA